MVQENQLLHILPLNLLPYYPIFEWNSNGETTTNALDILIDLKRSLDMIPVFGECVAPTIFKATLN